MSFNALNGNVSREGNVDNTQNIISFCTGYGGLELGIRRAGVDVRTICYLEIEVYVQAVLVKAIQEGRLCPAPIWTNVKSFDARPFRGVVDGITGGFPCQPFSSAGKRKGQEDPRHLWPSIANSIRLCRPGWVFLENVPGLVTLGLRDVLQDLGQMGYRTTWGIFSAEEVGAPHQRKRVFILACLPNTQIEGLEGHSRMLTEQDRRCDFTQNDLSKQELGNTQHDGSSTTQDGRSTCEEQEEGWMQELERGCKQSQDEWPARPGEEQYEWEEPRVVANSTSRRSRESGDEHQERERCESDRGSSEGCDTDTEAKSFMGGATNGTQHRVDRLRLLGNGVVPQTAELAWKTLWKEMDNGN